MTPAKMMSQFREIRGNQNIVFSLQQPTLNLKVGLSDKVAADILGWMSDEYPKLTRQETLEALQAAIWWVMLFGAMVEK